MKLILKTKRIEIASAIILTALSLGITHVHGQELGKVNTKRPSRFSGGLMVSPDWQGRFFKGEKKESFDALGASDNEAQNKALAGLLKQNEIAGLAYTAGLHVQYDINKRWFARLGLYYSNKPVRAKGQISSLYLLPGYVLVPGEKTKSNFAFLELPLTFHYMLNKPFDKNKKGTCYTDYSQYNRSKPLFYVFLGPAYATNVNYHEYVSRRYATTSLPTTNSVYVDKYKLHHAGIYAGAGMIKYLNKKLFLTFDATARYLPARWYSKNFDTNVDPETLQQRAVSYHVVDKPWALALQLGMNYHF